MTSKSISARKYDSGCRGSEIAVRESAVNLRSIPTYIQEDLDVTKRCWLISALISKEGIISAWFEHGNNHRLIVHFDQDNFSHITLLDTLKKYGYQGKVLRD